MMFFGFPEEIQKNPIKMECWHMNQEDQKIMMKRKREQFERFNDWELQLREKPNSFLCLAAVSALYDLLPTQAKQRPVNVEGIVQMRKGLACLG